ncbi:MAG: D-2-hydroxyacid dehydrogenase [Erysipelotrichaceae bacterium]|nr:D-2-hydroxyacid dehydrogenase [Erysipelotrichaceae bacterium]
MKQVFVNVPTNDEQKERLRAVSKDYEFIFREEGKDPYGAQIIIGNVPIAKLGKFEKLEWLQSSAVGIDKYIKKGVLKEGVLLSNAVDVHTKEVAEHCLAMLLAMVKKLFVYHDDQKDHRWVDEGKVKEISKLKVTVVGLGNIGSHLAKQLKALGVYVIGVKRTMIDKPGYVDELYTDKDLDTAIGDVDAVISILPGNKANEGLFTYERFSRMRKDALFINVGRGNLCSNETIRRVLDEKVIAGMALDVFEKEPLDKDDPLWEQEGLIITPHAAGSYHLDSAFEAFLDLCEENLKRYINDEPLKHLVEERE